MRKVLAAVLLVVLALPVWAEGVARPVSRPDAAASADASVPRPARRPGSGAAPLDGVAAATATALIEAALPPLPDPAPVVLPLPPDFAAIRAPRDRLAEASAPNPAITLSAANAPRLPEAAAAAARVVRVAPPALGPRARRAGPEQVTTATAVLPPLRPLRRTAAAAPVRPALVPVIAARPRARPDLAPAPAPALAPTPAVVTRAVPLIAPRPEKRPRGLAKRRAAEAAEAEIVPAAALRVRPGEGLVRSKKGSVCGDPDIRGEKLAPIPARMQGCGIADPVRVTEVDGVRLSTPATLDCDAARALKTWIVRGLKPAVGRKGVAEIKVAASYACRPRNNVRGARVSEHGRGNAIDISAVVTRTNEIFDVLTDYRRERGKPLRTAHKAACGIFGTTLGPGSDGYHENHLHFDVASYRSGPYCR